MLSLLLWLPAVGAAMVLLRPRASREYLKAVALFLSGFELVLAAGLILIFPGGSGEAKLAESAGWIPVWGIGYRLSADGISVALVALTALLTFLAFVGTLPRIREGLGTYVALILVLETGQIGVFLAQDLFLFYVFWEVMLIPMALLIYRFGHEGRRHAAIKFFLYTMAGSLLLFFAILYLGLREKTFDLAALARSSQAAGRRLDLASFLLFGAFFAAFAIKVPMFPFHTWLPDAHVQAPTAGSVLLAGVLLKMGAYGFLRIAIPLTPGPCDVLAPLLVFLSVAGIIYGALMALAQDDVKKLIAYSSVSHMGFVTLGIFSGAPEAASGAVFQMVNHGISTGALFLVVGALHERRHTHSMAAYGGLAARAPVLMTLFLFMVLSSIGLPGLNGFVGELLILAGAFRTVPWHAAAAALGVVLGAVYLLRLYQKVAFGPEPISDDFPDATPSETAALLPLAALALILGLFPGATLLDWLDPSVRWALEKDGLFQKGEPRRGPSTPLGAAPGNFKGPGSQLQSTPHSQSRKPDPALPVRWVKNFSEEQNMPHPGCGK